VETLGEAALAEDFLGDTFPVDPELSVFNEEGLIGFHEKLRGGFRRPGRRLASSHFFGALWNNGLLDFNYELWLFGGLGLGRRLSGGLLVANY
jgi:hypothetical protein